MQDAYMAIDFELCNQHGKWIAYGAVVALYPSGEVVATLNGSIKVPMSDFDEATRAFWDRHPHVLEHIFMHATADRDTHERQLAEFVDQIKNVYPDIHVIGDNVATDYRLLGNIMARWGKYPLQIRSNNVFRQCTCTWSYRRAIQNTVGRSLNTNSMAHIYKVICGRHRRRPIDNQDGPRHMPVSDCRRILSNHFKALDIGRAMGRQKT